MIELYTDIVLMFAEKGSVPVYHNGSQSLLTPLCLEIIRSQDLLEKM